MSFDPPVALPAGYVTGQAIAYVTAADRAVLVSQAAPLPVAQVRVAAAASALSATASASTVAGPFAPELGRPIWLTLSGAWTGSVQLLRSTDGGATKLPLTAVGQPYGSYTGNANEPVVEDSCAGVTYWLQVALSAGTLSYRIAQ